MEITEDYVSFETAKLLNEKGFDGICETSYYISNNGCENAVSIGDFAKVRAYRSGLIPAPTLQMACKWVREKHHIFIQVELYSKRNDYCFNVFKNTQEMLIEYLEVCNSYEEAVEAALTYCLTNLLSKQVSTSLIQQTSSISLGATKADTL